MERFCAGEAILARRESWVEKVARKARRNRMAAAALAGVLVLATVAGFVAMHARASSRIAALTTQLQQRLESPSWSAEELADAERIADELSRLERKTTQEHRRRVVDRLADTIRQSMHRPNLSETDHRQIEASIALLKPRDATRAAQLRQELDQRLRQWTPIYSLKPPFENLQTLPVQPGSVGSEGLSFTQQRVELPVTIIGNTRMEAEFGFLQEASKGVGFAIQGEKGKRYEFRLTPAPPPKTNAAPNRIELDLNASDLTERLKGWYADTPNTASVIMEEGRPIIRLENRTHSSKTVSLAKWFDPAFHQGKEWEASFRYRISNFQIPTGANTNNWNVGMRIFIEGKRSNGSYSSALLRFFKNCDWTPATIRFRIPRDVPRIKFAFEIRSAIGRLEVSDLKLTERNADGSADSPSKLLLAQPQQEWHPETNPAHAWMVSGDTRNMMVMEDNGKRFLRLTSDGTADRTSVTGHFHVDPQTVETATLTARARVNQFESLSQTNASLYIILTAKDSLGRSLNTKTWGFNSPCDWHAKSFEISIPPDACFLAIGVSAWSCRASIDIGGLACNLKLRPVVSEGSSQPMLTILRDNKVLRERPVPSNIITVDPVRLAAECIGGALRLQVGDEPPIEANDPFPLSIKDTRPTFIVGGDVRLRSLAVCRHSMPAKPNPLEIGDELFTAGRFHEAQSAYENQTRKSSDPDTQQQAHYKIAMCLLQQKRPKEAESEFALVAKSNSLTWSSLAACQLWTIYLDQRRNEEADAVFLSLRSKRDFAQILRSLTPDIQEAINKGYSNRARAMLEYGGPADWQMAVERLPQLLEVADALNMHPFKDKHSLAMRLAESYAALGQTDRALDVMRAQFDQLEKEDQAAAAGYRSICHNSCDFYRRLWAIKGQPKEALAVLERWDQRIPHTLFAVTTARCLLAMNRLPEAEKKLTDVVANTTSLENEDACGSLVAANLLLGLIAEKRQGPEAARQVWAEAFCRLRQAVPNGNPVDRINESSRSEFFQFMLLASLSGELKDSDMPTLRKRLGDLGQVQTGEDASKKTVLAGFTVSVTRQSLVETFSSERGAVYARKVIRGDLSRNEERHTTFALLMEQFFIQDSIGRNNLTTEVESIYWKFAQQFLEAFRTDQLSSEQCMSFAIAWKGITNIFGWESLQSDLTPALRGPMAFVMGHRYIKLGKKEDAISFFHTAKNDAAQIPDGNALVKAADDAMKKLSAK
ncbi:MAG: hypothetical protein NTY01_16070 [Verrucomicrobia bacterium]|nr:hypothetical protein [Verrucomicrobiota bacterium]